MSKKFNSTTNQKYSNNHPIFNLKSTSQKINLLNIPKDTTSKSSNNKGSKSFGDFLYNNNSINPSQSDKSSSSKQNLINDEYSIDNISNIIEPQKKRFIDNQIFFEDNKSSIIDNNFKNKSNFIPRLTTDINNFSDNKIKLCDSHTKSFQLKMKKMKEMNKVIFKDNFINKNNIIKDYSNKSENTYKSSNKNNYIINCKQKIISMKNKNTLMGNMNDFNNFNIKLNDNNINQNKEIKVNKINPFLCCYGKSSIN